MTRHEYTRLDVFTDTRFGGNQLAVFRDGRGLDTATMQAIATELNLAETTFVLPPSNAEADQRVRIFTPAKELPFAGHPTLGTAYLLADGRDRTVRLEEGVGIIPVAFRDGFGQMVQQRPVFEAPPIDRNAVAAAVSLDASDLRDDVPVEVGSSGIRFVFAPARGLEAVRRARPRSGISADNVYVFALGGDRPDASVHGRMFGYGVGITEDAASGSAQGPLGAFLVRNRLVPAAPTVRIRSEQGFEMGRPSVIDIEIDVHGGEVTEARVGGHAIVMGGGWIEL